MNTATVDLSHERDAIRDARRSIAEAMSAHDVGHRLDRLMGAYRSAADQSAFCAAMIGELAASRI